MPPANNQAFITPLTSHAQAACDGLVGGGAFTVWFLGGDAKLRQELCDKLPPCAALGALGTRLDEAADRVERALLDLDQQTLAGDEDRLAWSASLIGDRSPYAGDLQLNVARYLVINDIVSAGGRHLFFTDDVLAAAAFEATAQANGLDLSLCGARTGSSSPLETLRARVSALKTHWLESRTLKKLRRAAPWGRLAACDVLLIDWAGSGTFNLEGATQRAGNLARMPSILRDAGHKVGFIANPLSWVQPFNAIAANAVSAFDPVVMANDCRTLRSVVRGAWATWRMGRRLKTNFRAVGHDLTALFALECRKDRVRPQSTLAYAFGDMAKTLARHGVHPKAIVYPFENQGWERALLDGARRFLPDTRMIAYLHAPVAARYIGMYPPHSDIEAGRLPDQLVVLGPRYLDMFTQHGWPQERLVMGGSLRFETALENPPQPAQAGGNMVLVATSIDFDEALDLVLKAGRAVNAIADTRLVVNFHPVVDQAFRDSIRAALVRAVGEDAMGRMELSTERSIDLIGHADVLLYNSSGAVFDAFFAGVPTVYVAVDGRVNYDKVPGAMSRRVIGGTDLQNLLQELLMRTDSAVPDLSIGGTFAPVDENAILGAVQGAGQG